MRDLRHPGKPFQWSETDLDATLVSNEDSEKEDHHLLTGANRSLHEVQNTQTLNDTTGSQADHYNSTSTTKPLDPVNQNALGHRRTSKQNLTEITFSPQNHTYLQWKARKTKNSNTSKTYFRMQAKLTEEMKINTFHAHLRGLALKTFKISNEHLQQHWKIFERYSDKSM